MKHASCWIHMDVYMSADYSDGEDETHSLWILRHEFTLSALVLKVMLHTNRV